MGSQGWLVSGRIMLREEDLHRFEEFEAIFGPRKEMIGLGLFDIRNVLASLAQLGGHFPAVADRNARVARAVDKQHGNGDLLRRMDW